MPLEKDDYVVVNIWTSDENKAIPGANVGHVSIETRYNYISLWPGGGKESQLPEALKDAARPITANFQSRPTKYRRSYFDDCMAEAWSEDQLRRIEDISECKPNEIACIYNANDRSYRRVVEPVTYLDPQEILYAGVPCEATVRLVLYGLDIGKINRQFKSLKDQVTGWRMIGSNLLARNFSEETAESCASLALRCLCAGGMYKDLSSGLSIQTSSIVKPDVLLRQVVAAKERELEKYPETKGFFYPGESSLADIRARYKIVGQSANAEDDLVASKPKSSPGCTLL